jgi:hypothetical protein
MKSTRRVMMSVILVVTLGFGPLAGEVMADPPVATHVGAMFEAAGDETIAAPAQDPAALTPLPVVVRPESPAVAPALPAAPVAPEASSPPAPAPAAPANNGIETVALPGFVVPANLRGNNYCGQYAMTSVLNAMGGAVDFGRIYDESNPFGIFSAPTTLVEYLNRIGCQAWLRNGSTASALRAKLDAGKPVIVLVDCGGTPHWVAVSGYKKDAAGNVISYELRDSVWGISGPNGAHDMPAAEFERNWAAPLKGIVVVRNLTDYSNLLIDIGAYDPNQTRTTPILSGNFHTSVEDSYAGGINDVVTGFGTWSPTSVVSGGGKLVSGVAGSALAVPGRGIRDGGAAVLDDAGSRWERGGFINRTAAVGEYATGGLLYGTGATLNAGGQLISATGNAAGNTVKKAGNYISSAWNYIWN